MKFVHLFNNKLTPPRQAWLETFIGSPQNKLDIIDLHPRVFGVFPRPDHVTRVIQWQQEYRKVNYLSMPTRNELPGGTRKPWPQKGSGRARHGSVNSPIFLRGGWARGPRGPTTNFSILPHGYLVSGLQSILTIKLAQNDLKIVPSLECEISDPKDFESELAKRRWGPSVLLVDKCDTYHETLLAATKNINHLNLMPIPSLNVLSLAKHETLIFTEAALRDVEDKILHQLTRVDLINVNRPKQEST